MQLSAERLLAYASRHENQEWKTLHRKKPFRLKATSEGIEFTPSSGTPRRVPKDEVRAFCERFDAKRSFTPKDYRDYSWNSSYVLTIIESYLREEKARFG